MSSFYNPYQFIPVTGRIDGEPRRGHADYDEISQGAARDHPGVRHDLWHPECLSGRIVCSLYLNTPLVVGADQSPHNPSGATAVDQYTWRDVEAIPGSSLRGMVSSIAEALSQSALRVLDDGEITMRTTDKHSPVGTRRVTHPLKAADYFRRIDSELIPWCKDRQTLSPAELLFGAVEVDDKDERQAHARNLASRVRFYDALPARQPVQRLAPTMLRILDSPKFQRGCCVPMYLHLDGQRGGWLSKDDAFLKYTNEAILPNGRKFYLHHPQHQTKHTAWATAEPHKRANLKLRCEPLAAGQTFHFHVDFSNLSRAELTLLEHALSPGSRFQHRLGLGKPLGLGSVTLGIEGVFIIDPRRRYSAAALDHPEQRYHRIWRPRHTPSIEQRVADFSSHHGREWAALNAAPVPDKPAADEDLRLIDPDTLAILLTLGDPAMLVPATAVHTPLTQRQIETRSEDRTFEWFNHNDKRGRQALGAIKPGHPLPPLFSEPDEAAHAYAPEVAAVAGAPAVAASKPALAPDIADWLASHLPEHIDKDDADAVRKYLTSKPAAEAWEAVPDTDLKARLLQWWMQEVRALDVEMPMFNLLSKAAMRVLQRADVNVKDY
jgi:hypothetical protein